MKPLAVALLLVTPPAVAQQMCGAADTLYVNAHILTGNALETPHPEYATAIAVTKGKITYIDIPGKSGDAVACGGLETIDLHGAFVMPGFNDAHTHIASGGQQRLTVDLDNISSLAAMQAKIKAYAATLPAGGWILGGGWDHTKWESKTLPTAHDLDLVTGDHPAFLERTDGHIAILNTAALAAIHIIAATKSPVGGQIDLNPTTHEPTGIVRDAALTPIYTQLPKPDAATRRKALELSLADATSHGVTSLQDYSDWDDFLVLEQMEKEKKLPVRVSEWLTFNDPIDTLRQQQAHHDKSDPMLHTTMLKGFMDGSLGSRTAALLAPYSDDPKNSGLPRYDQEKLNVMTVERAEAGFQIGFHAIGDRANTMALTAFDKAVEEHRATHPEERPSVRGGQVQHMVGDYSVKTRFRIEHAQVLAPADFDRFAKLGVIASMQPSHLLTDMAWAASRLGPERSKYAYAWRSMLDHHIPLAFGTDYPVESINPFRGLYAAITRQNVEGTQTFHPEQKITLNEAIYAYTQGSAYAEFAETTKGILAPSYWADFIVLDRDITKAKPQDLLQTKVLRTVLAGQTQYTAP